MIVGKRAVFCGRESVSQSVPQEWWVGLSCRDVLWEGLTGVSITEDACSRRHQSAGHTLGRTQREGQGDTGESGTEKERKRGTEKERRRQKRERVNQIERERTEKELQIEKVAAVGRHRGVYRRSW